MDKSTKIVLAVGALGVLGLAYLFLSGSSQQGNAVAGGSGGGGNPLGQEYANYPPNYVFNLPAPNFPSIDYSGGEQTYDQFIGNADISTKKAVATNGRNTVGISIPGSPIYTIPAGSRVIVPVRNTSPGNFPTVYLAPSYNTQVRAPYIQPPAQPPLIITSMFGFPVVPTLVRTT